MRAGERRGSDRTNLSGRRNDGRWIPLLMRDQAAKVSRAEVAGWCPTGQAYVPGARSGMKGHSARRGTLGVAACAANEYPEDDYLKRLAGPIVR